MSERPFDLARRVPVADIAGVPLRRLGRDLFGPCPLCGGEPGSQRFHVTPHHNTWHCFGCKEGGGAIELAHAIRTGKRAKGAAFSDLLETARGLANAPAPPPPAPPVAKPQTDQPARPSLETWRRLWTEAKPARGSIVEAWFEARGLKPALHGETLARLRFNPRALIAAGKYDTGRWWTRRAPAMVAPVIDGAGRLRGVHCTYLSADGRAKADVQTPDGGPCATRKMWGACQGHVAPLTQLSEGPGPLVVGEGVETVLSFAEPWLEAGEPLRLAAALTLSNLQGGYVRDSEGRVTRPPLADHAAPPWLMLNPGHVVVLIDRDMANVRMRRRAYFCQDELAEMDANERAAFCAALATQHWHAAGALSVTPVQPRAVGQDFNDAIRGRTPLA